MKKQIIISMLVIFFSISFIPAQELSGLTFPQNTARTLSVGCNNESSGLCDSSVECKISIDKPSTENIVSNGTMGFFNEGKFTFNLTGENLNETGFYTAQGSCNGIAFSFLFQVNYGGNNLSSGQALLYIILFIMSIAFFCLTLLGAVRLRWENTFDNENNVIAINNLKPVKIALWYFVYIELIWITFLSSGIARNYLDLGGFTNFFFVSYWILISGLIPVTIVGLLFIGLIYIRDKKKKDAILRGVPIRK